MRRESAPWLPFLIALGLLLALPAFASDDDDDGASEQCLGPLKILLTNDDGFDAPGITAMQQVLLGAGYDVTIVAPLEQQSGRGGAISTDVGGFIDIKLESADGEPEVWSVDSTPSDSVQMGLEVILADDPPDLVVSGSNFGQNLGQGATRSSGTVGAVLAAAGFGTDGVPAIASSVGIDIAEAGIGFPSTFAANVPAAQFIAALIRELQANGCVDGRLLPRRQSVNVNFPVPVEDQQGAKLDRKLGETSDFELVFQDVQGAVDSGGGGVLLNVAFPDVSNDPQPKSDAVAYDEGFVAGALMDGDMSASSEAREDFVDRVKALDDGSNDDDDDD